MGGGERPEQPKGMAESSLSARPPPLQYEWSQNMTNKQRQKNQLRVSEIKQRLNTISGHEDPPGPLVGEWLSAESRLEVEALATELKDLEWRLDGRNRT